VANPLMHDKRMNDTIRNNFVNVFYWTCQSPNDIENDIEMWEIRTPSVSASSYYDC
jgi:hypothetical protein